MPTEINEILTINLEDNWEETLDIIQDGELVKDYIDYAAFNDYCEDVLVDGSNVTCFMNNLLPYEGIEQINNISNLDFVVKQLIDYEHISYLIKQWNTEYCEEHGLCEYCRTPLVENEFGTMECPQGH